MSHGQDFPGLADINYQKMYPPRAIVALADRQTHGSTKDPSPMQRKTARPLISILIQYLRTHHLRP